jgi:hypothetical protein
MVALRRDDERLRNTTLPFSAPRERGPRGDATARGEVAPSRAGPALRIVRAPLDAPLPRVRADALPEHTDYPDTGCDVSESCLRCPLARCKYDVPAGGRSLSATARNREIVLLRERYRAPINLLASTYGVTRRTVFRALREARLKSQGPKSQGNTQAC